MFDSSAIVWRHLNIQISSSVVAIWFVFQSCPCFHCSFYTQKKIGIGTWLTPCSSYKVMVTKPINWVTKHLGFSWGVLLIWILPMKMLLNSVLQFVAFPITCRSIFVVGTTRGKHLQRKKQKCNGITPMLSRIHWMDTSLCGSSNVFRFYFFLQCDPVSIHPLFIPVLPSTSLSKVKDFLVHRPKKFCRSGFYCQTWLELYKKKKKNTIATPGQ